MPIRTRAAGGSNSGRHPSTVVIRSIYAHAKSTRSPRAASTSVLHGPGHQKRGNDFHSRPGCPPCAGSGLAHDEAPQHRRPHAYSCARAHCPFDGDLRSRGRRVSRAGPLRRCLRITRHESHGPTPSRAVAPVGDSHRSDDPLPRAERPLRTRAPGSRSSRPRGATRPRRGSGHRPPRRSRGGPSRGLRRTRQRAAHDLRAGPPSGIRGPAGTARPAHRDTRARASRLRTHSAAHLSALGTAQR